MNSRSTWIWIGIALALFGAIVAVEKFSRPEPPGLTPLLAEFRPANITSIQLSRPEQRDELRVERTASGWQITKPVNYPAQAVSIDTLLVLLQRLAVGQIISGAEVRKQTNSAQAFGLANPQVTLTLLGGGERKQMFIGALTAPGDQMYVQVVGVEGIYVIDAELLKYLPRKLDDWRDTALVDLARLNFNRLVVSNAVGVFELQRGGSNQPWRVTSPKVVRADSRRINEALVRLHSARVSAFAADDAKADLEVYGLNAPTLELTLAQDTNVLTTLFFGKSPTNDFSQLYARRGGLSAVLIVPAEPLEAWRAPMNQFRDPRVVSFAQPVDQLEFLGGEAFTVQRTATNTWRLPAADFPVDAKAVTDVITLLGNLKIEQFKDSVTDADLPGYGLSAPARQLNVSSFPANGNGTATSNLLAALSFGVTNAEVYARRADENPVYAIRPADFQALPTAAWQLRERRLWNFSTNDVVRIFVQQGELKLELRRAGPRVWIVAAGGTGVVNGLALEEAVNYFGGLTASAWVGRGAENRERFGFNSNSLQLTFEFKTGPQETIEFGGKSADQYPYAAVQLAGQTWIMEFPIAIYEVLRFALGSAVHAP